MSEFERVVERQELIGKYILNFWTNVQKSAKGKRDVFYFANCEQRLERYWSDFYEGNFKVNNFPDAAKSNYVLEDRFSTVEESYAETSARIQAEMAALQSPSTSSQPSTSAAPEQAPQDTTPLPTISLPKFSGDPTQWTHFKDRFTVLVHDRPRLSKGIKLQHLLACLQGPALRLLSNIKVEDGNYDTAWNKLHKRYGHKRQLLSVQLRALLSLPRVTKGTADELTELIDRVDAAARALRQLNRPTELWDDWFVQLIADQLDEGTRLEWETSLPDLEVYATYSQIIEFLEARAHALRTAAPPPHARKSLGPTKATPAKSHAVSSLQATTESSDRPTRSCLLCQAGHFFSYCPRFRRKSAVQRQELVRQLNLCQNCFKVGHKMADCTSSNSCRVCQSRHHTMIHGAFQSNDADGAERVNASHGRRTPNVLAAEFVPSSSSMAANTTDVAVTSSAVVYLESSTGHRIMGRALLDSGSDKSFVTERVAQLLHLKRTPLIRAIRGFGGVSAGVSKSNVTLTLVSREDPSFRLTFDALTAPKLTSVLPRQDLDTESWPHLRDLSLADPWFNQAASVDVILGAHVFGEILSGAIRGPAGSPSAYKTALGWVITGQARAPAKPGRHSTALPTCAAESDLDLHQLLRRFWEIEESTSPKLLSPEEEYCEQLFRETVTRDSTGRYSVSLPIKNNAQIGGTRKQAVRILHSNERRHRTNSAVRPAYVGFMREYLSLGHMEPVPSSPPDSSTRVCYLPHHAVFKKSDPSRKIRVVFNASARDDHGNSLNDWLLPGPKLQPPLWAIVARWRLHRIAFTADVVKMFRQIRVRPFDCDLQRIVWRASPEEDVQDYRLLTVTYGTSSAPFLALRVLQQLAMDEEHRFPKGALALRRNTYVDDIFTGADSLEEATRIQRELLGLAKADGFDLAKFASNSEHLALARQSSVDMTEGALKYEQGVSALGLRWNPTSDCLCFSVSDSPLPEAPTKRMVLSDAAKLFDPVGWLAPVLVSAKILMQNLWLRGIGWDDLLPSELASCWRTWRAHLPRLQELQIPRWVNYSPHDTYQIHGFCDASERAYAATTYLRSRSPEGIVHCHLLRARTKVAPVKTVTIPRLELCAAALLAELVPEIVAEMGLTHCPIHLWTDSQVTLAWIRGHPSRWKPFVANRVSQILSAVPDGHWHHVGSKHNPADGASRGVSPMELLHLDLWWHGPSWLLQDPSAWPIVDCPSVPEAESEARRSVTVLVAQESFLDGLLGRYSSLTRLIRVTAYLRRVTPCNRRPDKPPLAFWVRHVQGSHFELELGALRTGQPISGKSSIARLTPFLDEDGLLRVGGRIDNAPLPFDERHPIILPKDSHLTQLIVAQGSGPY
ncbi:uncharacterized protein LOC143363167 [Halictus rubicundus]|uniref:uncharacterized protein LOC143363167 n=1 Tax=Halictus rubicundus TaxID=77578 RepID=UPI0040361EF2